MKGRKDRDATFAYQNAGGLKDSIHERGRGGLSGKPGCSQGQGAGQQNCTLGSVFDVPGNEDYGLLHGGQNG